MVHSVAVLIALHVTAGQAAPWRDPSPHARRVVTVDSSVRLEVLDWGGSGRPLVFVDCYLSAHAFDDIAPKLTDQFRVHAVTRRGVGSSDRPATGYDPNRRAEDILEVVTALRLEKPILVGHSCAGAILHTLGAEHPDRLGGLVYLDAAEDPTLRAPDYPPIRVDLANLPARAGTPAPVVFPEAERRQLAERPLDPAIRKAIVEDHHVRPEYARIRVPVLAIFRTTTLEQALKEYPPRNDQQFTALIQGYAASRAMLEKWQAGVRSGVRDARIVELPGASLYMFLTNEADVIREIRAFAAAIPR